MATPQITSRPREERRRPHPEAMRYNLAIRRVTLLAYIMYALGASPARELIVPFADKAAATPEPTQNGDPNKLLRWRLYASVLLAVCTLVEMQPQNCCQIAAIHCILCGFWK
jgi:hypothetical protein